MPPLQGNDNSRHLSRKFSSTTDSFCSRLRTFFSSPNSRGAQTSPLSYDQTTTCPSFSPRFGSVHTCFNMVINYIEKEGESLTAFENQITTKSAMYRVNVKPWSTNMKGELISRLYNKERMLNHAAALQLIAKKTAIPVPKLIGSGENPDGTAWLEIECTHGGIWLDVVGAMCRMPPGKKHTDGECEECARIAEANASRYIQDEILPATQLASVRHHRLEWCGDPAPVGHGLRPQDLLTTQEGRRRSRRAGIPLLSRQLARPQHLDACRDPACLEGCGLGQRRLLPRRVSTLDSQAARL